MSFKASVICSITILSFFIFIMTLPTEPEEHEDIPQGIVVAEYVKYFFPKMCYQKYFAKGKFNAPRNCYLTVRTLNKIDIISVFEPCKHCGSILYQNSSNNKNNAKANCLRSQLFRKQP